MERFVRLVSDVDASARDFLPKQNQVLITVGIDGIRLNYTILLRRRTNVRNVSKYSLFFTV